MSAPASPKPLFISFNASFGSYAGRAFGIAFLNLLTLGLYKPYGLTRMRRELYGNIYAGSHALEYSGNARALSRVTFYPSLALLFMLFAPAVLQFEVPFSWAIAIGVLQIFMLAAFYQYLFFLQRRYELANVSWQGQSFDLSGSPASYMWASFGSQLANLLSLGLLAPWRRALLARRIHDNLVYGRQPVSCTVRAMPLLPYYLPGWAASMAGFIYAIHYVYTYAFLPLWVIYQGGAADPAMASSLDMSGGMGGMPGMSGAVDPEAMAQLGTAIHAIVVPSVAWPLWVLWRKLCLAPYEAAWWQQFTGSLSAGSLKLRFEGGASRLFLLDAISFSFNFMLANLTRPFTTYARIRYFCRHSILLTS